MTTVFGSPGEPLFEMARSYAQNQGEKDEFPTDSRSYGERYFNRRPSYWVNRSRTQVRVCVVDARCHEVSRVVMISIDDYKWRPDPDRHTKAEARWAFDLCGFTVPESR